MHDSHQALNSVFSSHPPVQERVARLMALVHHDDAVREFEYGVASHIGTFSDALMAEAKKENWNIISMKNDWKRVFAFE